MFNRTEYHRRLAFCGRKTEDVLRALGERGVTCSAPTLSRAIAGEEKMACLANVRAHADVITAAWVREAKHRVTEEIEAALVCLGINGAVRIEAPSERCVPVWLDGELFGLYDLDTKKML